MSGTHIVDSSGWLEYFADGKAAAFFAPAIEDSENQLVSVITIYEVFKKFSASAAKTTHCRSRP